MNRRAFRAVMVALAFATIGGLLSALGIGLLLALILASAVSGLGLYLSTWAIGALAEVGRNWAWGDEEGRHHSFNGVLLDIQDDGRHVWIGAQGLRTVLGTTDSDERLAARHPGRTRRDEEGALMLRVDTVVDGLAVDAIGHDPRRLRLRRYLERDVLFPAAERRRRSERMD